jgi:hypothetical protein
VFDMLVISKKTYAQYLDIIQKNVFDYGGQ